MTCTASWGPLSPGPVDVWSPPTPPAHRADRRYNGVSTVKSTSCITGGSCTTSTQERFQSGTRCFEHAGITSASTATTGRQDGDESTARHDQPLQVHAPPGGGTGGVVRTAQSDHRDVCSSTQGGDDPVRDPTDRNRVRDRGSEMSDILGELPEKRV